MKKNGFNKDDITVYKLNIHHCHRDDYGTLFSQDDKVITALRMWQHMSGYWWKHCLKQNDTILMKIENKECHKRKIISFYKDEINEEKIMGGRKCKWDNETKSHIAHTNVDASWDISVDFNYVPVFQVIEKLPDEHKHINNFRCEVPIGVPNRFDIDINNMIINQFDISVLDC